MENLFRFLWKSHKHLTHTYNKNNNSGCRSHIHSSEKKESPQKESDKNPSGEIPNFEQQLSVAMKVVKIM